MLEREPREVHYLVVVLAAHHDDVELDRVKPGTLGRERGCHGVEAEVPPRDGHDAVGTKAVRRQVDAIEPGVGELLRHRGKAHAIRRERDVLDVAHVADHPHQRGELRADGRLPSREPHAAQAKWRELRHDVANLLVRKDVRLGQPGQPLEGHAVATAEVAAIGDGDAEILDRSPKLVGDATHGATPGALATPAAFTHSRVPST